MRQSLVAGNWKMNGSKASIKALLQGIIPDSRNLSVELAVFPSYVFLPEVEKILTDSNISWGAQNVSDKPSGAYTGEISAAMLLEFGCRYVIVGHSERRTLYGETNQIVAAKFAGAHAAGLVPILCVGETLKEREANQTETVIQQQLDAVLTLQNGIKLLANAVVAYEPVWAIGTGMTATPEQAQAVHSFLRKYVAKYDETIAQKLRILYGGSVRAANAASLFAMPDIDGGLVGNASLDAKEFIEIAKSCNK